MSPSLSSLLRTPEGRVLASGLTLAVVGLVGLALGWVRAPADSQVLVAMTATNVLLGRAAAMSFGYAVGLGHGPVLAVNILVETVLVLLFYPLFVLSWRQLVQGGPLRRILRRTREAAERHQGTIRRYGIAGLFAFVWFPFWMTGPVVGCAIGFLLGLSARTTLTVVLAGTYLAIGAWAVALHELHDKVAQYSASGPMALVVILVVIAVAGSLLHRRREEGDGDDGERR
jgi:uncharacterized membrane protein